MAASTATKTSVQQLLFSNASLLLYLAVGLFFRFWNLGNRLYFIWDQGRDAWELSKIARGELTLIGPTSGVQGFYLGPLWYYVGLPGYLLGGGNPWVICVWYVLLASLALPLFWKISHLLFQEKSAALLSAYALALCPASIARSIFIWNPLLSIPLMALAFYSFLRARSSRAFLTLGFFSLALTLQSEFAYAVFFIPVLLLLIPWIRKKVDVLDYVSSILAIGITLLPQAAFELRHHFIMTKSLMQALTTPGNSVSFGYLLLNRPLSLFDTTRALLVDSFPPSYFFTAVLVALAIFGAWFVLKHSRDAIQRYNVKLTIIFAAIPYIGFMLWRGNTGQFFDYYLTPHFMFLVLLIVFGYMALRAAKSSIHQKVAVFLPGIFLGIFLAYVFQAVLFVDNQGGLKIDVESMAILYQWRTEDGMQPGVFRIYTPNVLTEQYDYLIHWYANAHGLTPPYTAMIGDPKTWYLLTEQNHQANYDVWYAQNTAGGKLVRQKRWGSLTLETWTKK